MGNSRYIVECRSEELKIYAVTKKKENRTYYLTLKDDGEWIHTCKARDVRGDGFVCRHIKMVVQKYYVNEKYKHLFNLTKKKRTS